MWSVVQYRRLGKLVKHDLQHGSSKSKTGYADVEKDGPQEELQANQDDGDQAGGKEEEKSGPKDTDDKIYVKTLGDQDPLDPRNWPLLDRSKNIAILSFLIFSQGWAGAAESMANTKASQQFGVSKVAENLSTAMYLFGIGSGALFAGPVSETVGRNPTYLVATFCYLFFVLGCALTPTFGGQVVCRYFVGLFASATLSINGSSVRDQFRPVKRAFVFPVIAWANVASPVIAPIAGGWIVNDPDLDWRWTAWITVIISSAAFLVAFFFLPETYLPLLLEWKAKHLRRETGNRRYVSQLSEMPSFVDRMRKTLKLPIKFFASEPVVAVLGGYLVLLYILLFTFLSGFDYVFKETYQLSSGMTGSCFGAIAAGATVFTFGAPGFYSWARHETEHVRGAPVEPEFRLWPAMVAGPMLPIVLFWLGWTNFPNISIWAGLGACFVFGGVLIAIYVGSYEYIVDSYGDHSAIALSSITMLRYLISGGMVMATRPLYEGVGVHWTMTLLGCVAVLLAPAPAIFYKIGPRLREKSEYAESSK
ncbi:major facilitator superfamily domain-containing protein [Apodospora peruviana]|uniref:Major facilitator superfamily domain-containing protein n=1 Tax=Apodospora peruviana TaxID=516989 RepID=A0AAE0HU40_9PEZI|nr:major facilitator superfamily domain-containing protein [Apodospora peruviana]